MNKHIGKFVLALALACVVFVGILYGNNCFGIQGDKGSFIIALYCKLRDEVFHCNNITAAAKEIAKGESRTVHIYRISMVRLVL